MKSVRRTSTCGLWVLAASCLSLGCESTNTSETAGGPAAKLESAAVARFPDVPVPVGFTLVERNSADNTNVRTRFACHQMVGTATPQQVADFYIEKLPLNNWVWKADSTVAGERNLLFRKTDEWCHITLKRDGGKTVLRLWVMTIREGSTGVPKR